MLLLTFVFTVLVPQVALPANSEWVVRIPVSTTYTVIPEPAELSKTYPSVEDAACEMRSNPKGAFVC